MWDQILEWVVSYGGQALGAIATLVVGHWSRVWCGG